jgi:hypothetical protein
MLLEVQSTGTPFLYHECSIAEYGMILLKFNDFSFRRRQTAFGVSSYAICKGAASPVLPDHTVTP